MSTAAKKPQKINLRDKVECTVTDKGEKHTSNKWKKGDKITCHPVLAQHYLSQGLIEKDWKPIVRKEPYKPLKKDKDDE